MICKRLQAEVEAIPVNENVCRYIAQICEAARQHKSLAGSLSARASIALMRASQAVAFLENHAAVHPDDVKRIAIPVLQHRLGSRDSGSAQEHTRRSGRRSSKHACRLTDSPSLMATHFTRRGPQRTGPRLTNRGIVLVVIALAAILAGSYFQERFVTQLGLFALLLALLSVLLCWLNVKRLDIVRLAPPNTHALTDFRIELIVTNQKPWLDSFAIELEDSLLPYTNRGLLANWVRAGGPMSHGIHDTPGQTRRA